MPKRKSANQLTTGGWDTLPHGMGQVVTRRYNTRALSSVSSLGSADGKPEVAKDPPVPETTDTPSTDSFEAITLQRVTQESAKGTAGILTPTKVVLTPLRRQNASAGIQSLMVITGLAIRANLAVKVNVEVTATMIHVKDPDFKPRVIRGASNLYGLTIGRSPYPHRIAPTPEACEEVHRILTEIHGEVRQPEMVPSPSLEVAGCGEVPSVLDALLRTLISGNTLMARADAAIQNLAQKYGIVEAGMVGAGSINWEKVRLSSLEELVDTIKPAGCARVKGAHIKAILDMVCEENLAHAQARVQDESVGTSANSLRRRRKTHGKVEIEKSQLEQALSLDHMHSMNKDEAMAAFLRYPGIGVKTAACVILFCLRIPCFAVDTHVHKFSQWLGWVPAKASELDSYNHGEFKVPDHLKYGLHQLFIRHGQECYKCRKATRPGTEEWSDAPECPLEHLLNRRKIEVAASEAIGKKSKSKKHKAPDTDQSGEDEDTLEDSEEEKI